MSMQKTISRREFLKSAGAGSMLAVAGTSTWSSTGVLASLAGSPRVPTRPFGNTGIDVSILSLGGMFDIRSNQLLLKQAIKWGVTYWDTADCYQGGNSEIGIGQFFTKYPDMRKVIFLVTKSDKRDPNGMSELLYRSLKRMKTDHIDLYFIHGMSSINEINDDVKAWAEKAKSEGRIRLFGFSTHSNMAELMLEAAKLGWIDGIMMTYNFRIMHSDKMKAAVEACAKAGIGLTAMKTQGGGSVRTDSERELELAGHFMRLGFTSEQAKLKAVWENPHVASICSQMPNMKILTANIAAALDRTKLSAEDLKAMDHYAEKTASTYCAGCVENCEPHLGGAVPVGDIMRYLMYYHSYGEGDRARKSFSRIPQDVRDCLLQVDYRRAEDHCPQKLKIGVLMKEAMTVLGRWT